MQKFDVAIIGSGLGGLVCGYILSKEGYNVCIIEKNKQIGGCLQVFERNKCIFDTGMHYIGSMEEGQILHRFFKYFNLIDKLKIKKMDVNGFDVINFQGVDYKYAMGYENFIKTLINYFPAEKEGIIKYCNKLREISNNLNLYNLREVKTDNIIDTQYITESTGDFIKSVTTNKILQNVLAGTNSLYAGEPDKSPLYMHALINNFFIESAWRFVDGSAQLADLLAQSIIQNGGTILTNSKVEKLVCDNTEIRYAQLSNSEKIEAKNFISDVHPVVTLEMVESDIIKKVYRNRINNLENTLSTFSVYIVLKENTFKYLNYNYYYCKGDTAWLTSTYSNNIWPQGYMLFTPTSSKSDLFAENMTVLAYMKMDELKKWENTSVEKRGDEYKEFKHKKAEQLISLVEKQFPQIRNCIKTYYTSTPLTYRDYTGTKDGSMYGFLKDCKEPIKTYIPPKTKIPNLYLTGQNINLHGILGVTIGSLLTCGEFVGLNYLIRKINNA